MQKILAKELGIGNIRLSIRFWGIITTHNLDMRDPELFDLLIVLRQGHYTCENENHRGDNCRMLEHNFVVYG